MENNSKHILIITPGFPESEADYLCIPPLQGFVLALSKLPGIKLSVLSLHYPYSRREYSWHGIQVYPCGGKNSKFPKRLLTWGRVKRAIGNIEREYPVNVFHSFWYGECALLAEAFNQNNHIFHLNTLMGQEALKVSYYQKILLKKDFQVVALSNFQASKFGVLTGRKPDRIIPWGLDKNNLPLPKQVNRDIDIIGVGSFTALKDFSTFIRAVEVLAREIPDLKCFLIGDGPERSHLEQMVVAGGLQKNITFTGIIPRTEIAALMNRTRVLLHPSSYESYGYIFAEGLYYGVRIVSRKVGFAEESSHWKIFEKEDEIVPSIWEFFDEEDNQETVYIPSIEETASQYAAIYASQTD